MLSLQMMNRLGKFEFDFWMEYSDGPTIRFCVAIAMREFKKH